MNWPLTHRIVAGLVFLVSLVLYLLTLAPTASFWDAGEFIAIASRLQVSHPPGAPFYMIIGRFLSMFVPQENAAIVMNLVSAFSAAFAVLLTHLIIVQLVRRYYDDGEREGAEDERTDGSAPRGEWTFMQHVAALAGGAVGSLSYGVTDAFWFNAVESELYAISMLFTALVVWMILRWSEVAREEIAGLGGRVASPFGLRTNRYLVLIAYMFGLAIGVHLLNVLAIFFIVLIFYFDQYDRPEWTTFQHARGIVLAGLAAVGVFFIIYPGVVQWLPSAALIAGAAAPIFVLGLIGAVAYSVYYTHTRRKFALNVLALSVMAVLIGYSTYAVIFIRSAANPPIDENDPENIESIVSYLKREQYGSTPLLSGYSYNDETGRIDDEQTPGARTKLFPRRWSPDHVQVYAQYSSDMDFFWRYQLGHMFWRYFGWQYVGKDSDIQDAPVITGIAALDAGVENRQILFQTPSERKSRNTYFALPLLIGLFGTYYHFRRDWRRAIAVLALFLVSGVGLILYLNQYPGQPRERDYSYVAAFFAFNLWIGIGAAGLVDLVVSALRRRGESAARIGGFAVAAAAFLGAFVLVLAQNYDDHDRTGQYVAPDYAYNMLNSVAPNGILFTNGDNDTFPLWYLQEVERERQDVRVVNLSLLQTPWYIKQLKNQASRTSAALPMTFTDAQVDELNAMQWQPQDIELPVPGTVPGVRPGDASRVQAPMRWRLNGRQLGQDFYALYPNDLAILNLLQTNAQQGWTRPIYFAVTVSPDGTLDLGNYFQLEGQAHRVVPIRHDEPLGRIADGVTLENLRRFRFRGLADPSVYHDENARRMVDNYRNIYSKVAEDLSARGRQADAVALLDTLMAQVPFETIPGDARSFTFMARGYIQAGAPEKATALMQKAEPLAFALLEGARSSRDIEIALNFAQSIRFIYLIAGQLDQAAAFSNRLADATGQPEFRTTPDSLRREAEEARQSLALDLASSPDVGAAADTVAPVAAPLGSTTTPARGDTAGN